MGGSLDLQEKVLYHQIHAAKVATDWASAVAALPLFWRHRLLPALLLTFVPPGLVSYVLARYVDLEPYRRSAAGRYVRQYMTGTMQAVRSLGAAVMVLGAWYRKPWALSLGLLLILFGWFRGLLFPHRATSR